jgi:cation transport ATPase
MEETKNELSVDMSSLTGESLPVSKRKGDEVWSSSIVKQGQVRRFVCVCHDNYPF